MTSRMAFSAATSALVAKSPAPLSIRPSRLPYIRRTTSAPAPAAAIATSASSRLISITPCSVSRPPAPGPAPPKRGLPGPRRRPEELRRHSHEETRRRPQRRSNCSERPAPCFGRLVARTAWSETTVLVRVGSSGLVDEPRSVNRYQALHRASMLSTRPLEPTRTNIRAPGGASGRRRSQLFAAIASLAEELSPAADRPHAGQSDLQSRIAMAASRASDAWAESSAH